MGLPLFHTWWELWTEAREETGEHMGLGGGRARDKIQRLDDNIGGMSSNHCWALQTGIRARLPADVPPPHCTETGQTTTENIF